ncbi:hypothetical protein Zmor_017216 [Zophobas morio]|uniref:Uncharacterized protein n=1 Tax=Zophobas morio TaxID=2755281 RepID=A0AA38I8N7_9CUCU|nr:hypothetical protein Zmor_017216 [Zophobas morio]
MALSRPHGPALSHAPERDESTESPFNKSSNLDFRLGTIGRRKIKEERERAKKKKKHGNAQKAPSREPTLNLILISGLFRARSIRHEKFFAPRLANRWSGHVQRTLDQ